MGITQEHTMRFYDALKEFLAWKKFTIQSHATKGYTYDLQNLCLYLKNPELEDVTWQDIQEYSDAMLQLGWEGNSLVRKFISYRKFFEYWHKKNPRVMDHEWIPVKHMEYRIPRTLTEEHYLKLLKASPEGSYGLRNTVILNLLWDTGARVGEIISLNVSDLDLVNQLAIVKTEKSRGRRPVREIFWTSQTNANIRKWLAAREQFVKKWKHYEIGDALLLNLMGRSLGKRILRSGVSQALSTLSDNSGIPRVNPHSFRHHMGHDIIKKGGTNSDVSNILGHSSLDSSYIYTQMHGIELKKRYTQFKGK